MSPMPASASSAAFDDAYPALPTLQPARATPHALFQGQALAQLEALLPAYLQAQRWFGAKDQAIDRVTIREAVPVPAQPLPTYLSILQVHLAHRHECYLLPMALSSGDTAAPRLDVHPHRAIAWVALPGRPEPFLLHDATITPSFWRGLLHAWQAEEEALLAAGLAVTPLAEAIRTHRIEQVDIFGGEQSNSLALFDDHFCLKLYRRLEPGENPETELLEHLTRTGFAFAPRLYGTITFRGAGHAFVLGTLQQALPVETDGWTYALAMTQHFLDQIAGSKAPDASAQPALDAGAAPAWLERVAPEMLALARILGVRTAELHSTLARFEAPDQRPRPGDPEDTAAFLQRLRDEIDLTRRMLADHPAPPDGVPDDDAWQHGLGRLALLNPAEASCLTMRVHGDYHLGQVVYAAGAFYLLDFEGEPARSFKERRARDCHLRDVAGMLRSLEYAALSAWQDYRTQHVEADNAALSAWTLALVRWCEALLMDAYFSTSSGLNLALASEQRRLFLWAYLLQKALYEVRYELSHRPAWTWLPLRGLKRLLSEDR